MLVVITPGDDFLASWPQEDGVLKLSCVATFDVAEWGVRFDDAFLAEIFERHQVARGERKKAVVLHVKDNLVRWDRTAEVKKSTMDVQLGTSWTWP